jgi:hypothetical protein
MATVDVTLPDQQVGTTDAIGPHPRVVSRLLALTSVACVLVCTAAFVTLHFLPISGALDPAKTPLSNYALTPAAWLFDTGVASLIAGLACLLAALLAAGEVAVPSWPALLITLCCGAFTVVVLVPNHVLPDGALTPAAELHWVAAMVAFAALPVVPVLLARGHRARRLCSPLPRWAGWLSASAAVWFVALFGGSVLEFAGARSLWRVGGVVERGLAASEIVAALLLALWLCRGCSCRSRWAVPSSPHGVRP